MRWVYKGLKGRLDIVAGQKMVLAVITASRCHFDGQQPDVTSDNSNQIQLLVLSTM